MLAESENREVLKAWKRSPELDTVKEWLPEELKGHVERLVIWRLPAYATKEAEAALEDCRQRLETRQYTAHGRANAALLASKEEELGPSTLAEAAVSEIEPEDDAIKEGVDVVRTGQEIGRKIHGKELKVEGGETA